MKSLHRKEPVQYVVILIRLLMILLVAFCDQPGKELRQVMTFTVDEKVRACARITNNAIHALPSVNPILPESSINVDLSEITKDIYSGKYEWLKTATENVDKSDGVVNLSWASFHAHHHTRDISPKPISVLLPLFRHSACTPAMIKHAFAITQKFVSMLNPGQIPIVTLDQPL